MSKVKNIDIDKFLAELDRLDKTAAYNHMLKDKVEEARYNQERETLNQVIDMLYSSNFEKLENTSDYAKTDDMVLITKDQYNEYQTLIDKLDSELNRIVEIELSNWTEEVLTKLIGYLKSEKHLIYGADHKKKICNISYEDLDKALESAFVCTSEELAKYNKEV